MAHNVLVVHIYRVARGVDLIWVALCGKMTNIYVSCDFRRGSCEHATEFLDVLRLLAFCQVREINFKCAVKGFP